MYPKIVKDVIERVSIHAFYQVQAVLNMIEQGQELKASLNFLLGMVPAFQERHSAKYSTMLT